MQSVASSQSDPLLGTLVIRERHLKTRETVAVTSKCDRHCHQRIINNHNGNRAEHYPGRTCRCLSPPEASGDAACSWLCKQAGRKGRAGVGRAPDRTTEGKLSGEGGDDTSSLRAGHVTMVQRSKGERLGGDLRRADSPWQRFIIYYFFTPRSTSGLAFLSVLTLQLVLFTTSCPGIRCRFVL